ncbi:MAG: ribonuclease HI [Verrucomicrobia bacterium]|nr:ribonuclease HI [Verrucomicrobiota bacterium]
MAEIPSLKTVTIHTDGACEGNPGPGGWAALLCFGQHQRELTGAEPATTNNRMELQAAIAALAALKESCEVALYTDSDYLRSGITEWLPVWKANRWRTADRKPVKNDDLWRQLDELAARHRVTWHWLKGHAGHPDNERCDRLARAEVAKIRQRHTPEQLAALCTEFLARRSPDRSQARLL